ncbi:hypothetical protein DFJ66_8323 [Saccharothrix variisporea]|uniref:Uncharacterized protein n=1 Tax=Saccharothrix variisporea TaxID=543527 RepID=A0A495XTD8_9PSEU|nr:hypothetical protein DFJ66_8323 [Saccharothrix variisporea]
MRRRWRSTCGEVFGCAQGRRATVAEGTRPDLRRSENDPVMCSARGAMLRLLASRVAWRRGSSNVGAFPDGTVAQPVRHRQAVPEAGSRPHTSAKPASGSPPAEWQSALPSGQSALLSGQSAGADTTQLGLLAFVISVWPARRATAFSRGCSRKFCEERAKVLAATPGKCGRLRQAIRRWQKQEAPAVAVESSLVACPPARRFSLLSALNSTLRSQAERAPRLERAMRSKDQKMKSGARRAAGRQRGVKGVGSPAVWPGGANHRFAGVPLKLFARSSQKLSAAPRQICGSPSGRPYGGGTEALHLWLRPHAKSTRCARRKAKAPGRQGLSRHRFVVRDCSSSISLSTSSISRRIRTRALAASST